MHLSLSAKLGRQPLVFSPSARDYFARLDAAGVRVAKYDIANARLIDRLVANGGNFWPDSGAFNAMAGYLYPGNGEDLIPLHPNHDAGTLNAFVTGDWNAVTGLKGDGSTKYVDSNRADDTDPQNDMAIWTYLTEAHDASSEVGMFFGVGTVTQIWQEPATVRIRHRNGTLDIIAGSSGSLSGFAGASRNQSLEYLYRGESLDRTLSRESMSTLSVNHYIMARNNGGLSLPVNSRHTAYGIGPNLNGTGELAELDSILTDWQTDLANA